jgi:KUP system potassium uptake protein
VVGALGVVSLIFWSVMVAYVLLAMRADNEGEGGIMALITLLRRWSAQRGKRAAVVLAGLGIFGAALFFGDSMITPAISVLSAVEGLKVVSEFLCAWVIFTSGSARRCCRGVNTVAAARLAWA